MCSWAGRPLFSIANVSDDPGRALKKKAAHLAPISFSKLFLIAAFREAYREACHFKNKWTQTLAMEMVV
jgi:hypothetical protein